MTDTTYFESKVMPDYVSLLSHGLLTIEEYDDITHGEWPLDAVQAAAAQVNRGTASYATFVRLALKAGVR